jgi:hypothetical protein
MVVVAIAKKEMPPTNNHSEMVNTGRVEDGSFFCTWISGKSKGQGYITEIELEMLNRVFQQKLGSCDLAGG